LIFAACHASFAPLPLFAASRLFFHAVFDAEAARYITPAFSFIAADDADDALS